MKDSKARGKKGSGLRKNDNKGSSSSSSVDTTLVSSKLVDLFSLHMPRCSICGLDWFNDYEEEEEGCEIQIEGEGRKDDDELLTLKCRTLLPLPHCKCTTSLLNVPLHRPLNYKSLKQMAKDMAKHMKEKEDRLDSQTNAEEIIHVFIQKYSQSELSDFSLKHYPKKAMCKDCLMPFINTSNDVIELDYRSDPQHNPKFSVGGKCTCCRTRFNARALERSKSFMHYACGDINKKGRNNNEEEMKEWFENIKGTIQLVQETKKLKKILSRKIPRSTLHGTNTGQNNSDQEIRFVNEAEADTNTNTNTNNADLNLHHTTNILKWVHDEEDYSSDDCFSDDGFDDDGDARDVIPSPSQTSKRVANMIAPKEGEIRSDLIKKDPKFRQEVEDLAYITEKSKTKEGRLELGIESDADNDDDCISQSSRGMGRKRKYHQSAENLQSDEQLAQQLQEQERKNSIRVRQKTPKSPLLEAFEKQKSDGTKKRKTNSLLSAASSWVKNKIGQNPRRKKVGVLKYFETGRNNTVLVPKDTIDNISRGFDSSVKPITMGTMVNETRDARTDTFPCKPKSDPNINEPIEILSDSDDDNDNDGVTFSEEPNTCKQAWLEANDMNISLRTESHLSNDSSATSSTPIVNTSDGDRSIDAIEHRETNLRIPKPDGNNHSSRTNHKTACKPILNRNQYANNNSSSTVLVGQDTAKSSPTHSSLDEVDLSAMMAMGFDQDECVRAMAKAKNNIDLAINIILNQRQ